MSLDIVPLTLSQFRELFVALSETNQVHQSRVRAIVEECAQYRHLHAPDWKRELASLVEGDVGQLRAG